LLSNYKFFKELIPIILQRIMSVLDREGFLHVNDIFITKIVLHVQACGVEKGWAWGMGGDSNLWETGAVDFQHGTGVE
jgi:hypothetical protein